MFMRIFTVLFLDNVLNLWLSDDKQAGDQYNLQIIIYSEEVIDNILQIKNMADDVIRGGLLSSVLHRNNAYTG